MKKKEVFSIIFLILALIAAALIHKYREREYQKQEIIFDTFADITVVSKNKNVPKILDDTFLELEKYNDKFSYYDVNSRLYQINHTSNTVEKIDLDFYRMLTIASKIYAETDSLYDITIGELSELWDIERKRIPSEDSIKIALQNTGFDRISFTQNTLHNPEHLRINLGSIAKGLIIDKAVQYLEKRGIERGIVNIGGDIRIFGQKKAVEIGIQHPRKGKNSIIATLSVKDEAVVTSGDYERYFMVDGKRYHHILNPATGFPADSMISITVIYPEAEMADAYATALFLLSPEKAIALATKTKNLEAVLFYEKDGKLNSLQTSGIRKFDYERQD